MKDGGTVSKQVFSVTAKPDDGYLFLQFPGHPNIFTQARYFDEIEIMAKDAIFLILDIPKSEIELKIESPILQDFPQTYLEFCRREFINKVRSLVHLSTFHPAPSADGK